MTAMKKWGLCLLLACLCGHTAYAQRINIKGIVADSSNKQLVELATVALLKPTDSTLVQFTSTNEKGAFEFRKMDITPYLLKINLVGYNTYHKILDLKADTVLDTLYLSNMLLKEVTLKGEKDPVRIAKDTIEFNAGSFKTRTNATVEDLLKKIPGIQVDAKGNVKAQGEKVSKVFVNGKEFFGGTPQTATQNLPADAIDKVQVVDQKSDQANLSGVDDGQNTKIINIETKDQNKRMNFSKIMGGYALPDRYEAKANFNTFNKVNQFSIIGMSNNINETGFSFDDYQDFSNRGGQGMDGMDFEPMFMGGDEMSYEDYGGGGFNFGGWGSQFGFLRTNSVGINLNQSLTKKIELNGSYFLNHSNNVIEKVQNSQTYLNNNYFATNETNNQNEIGLGQKANLSLVYKIDSMRMFRVQTYLDYNNNDNSALNKNSALTDNQILTNDNQRQNANRTNRLNYRANIFYSQKFKKKGRTTSINIIATNNLQRQRGNLQARNRFFSPDSTALLAQDNNQNTLAQAFKTRATYSEPFSKKLTMNLNYLFQLNMNDSKREVFDIENEQRKPNALLSNEFDNTFDFHNGGLSLGWKEEKYSLTLGVASQLSHLKGNTVGLPTLEKRFENLLPNASFNYKITPKTRLWVQYNTRITAPSLNQLQPVPNNTNPLRINTGNPDLKPAYNHQFNANLNYNNPDKFSNFFGYFSGGYTTNNIVQEQTIDSKLVETSRPVNVNTRGTLRFYSNLVYYMNLKKLKSNAEFGLFSNYNQNINLINGITSLIHQQTWEASLGYNWNWENVLNFGLRASLERQQTRYEVNEAQNQRFLNQSYEANLDIEALKFMEIQSNLDFQINRGITNDFFQSLPLLNVAIAVPCLRGDRGEVKLRGVNLLNQNTGISQNIFGNTIQQEFINSLGRYVMLSFTYSFLDKAPKMPDMF